MRCSHFPLIFYFWNKQNIYLFSGEIAICAAMPIRHFLKNILKGIFLKEYFFWVSPPWKIRSWHRWLCLPSRLQLTPLGGGAGGNIRLGGKKNRHSGTLATVYSHVHPPTPSANALRQWSFFTIPFNFTIKTTMVDCAGIVILLLCYLPPW